MQSKEQFNLVSEPLGKFLKTLKEQVAPSDSTYLWTNVLALGASAQ